MGNDMHKPLLPSSSSHTPLLPSSSSHLPSNQTVPSPSSSHPPSNQTVPSNTTSPQPLPTPPPNDPSPTTNQQLVPLHEHLSVRIPTFRANVAYTRAAADAAAAEDAAVRAAAAARSRAAAEAILAAEVQKHKEELKKLEDLGNHTAMVKYYYREVQKQELPFPPRLHPRGKLFLSPEQRRDLADLIMAHVGDRSTMTPLPTLDGMPSYPLGYPPVQSAFRHQLTDNMVGGSRYWVGTCVVATTAWFGYIIIPRLLALWLPWFGSY